MHLFEKRQDKQTRLKTTIGPKTIELPYRQSLGNLSVTVEPNSRVTITDIDLLRGDKAIVLDINQGNSHERIQTFGNWTKQIFEIPSKPLTINLKPTETVRISTQTFNDRSELTIYNF